MGLLLTIQLVTALSVFHASFKQKNQRIAEQFAVGQNNFDNQFSDRKYYFSAFSQTVARDYGIRQLFNDDYRSFLVALENHRRRLNANMALALDPDGNVRAHLLSENLDGEYKTRIGGRPGELFPGVNIKGSIEEEKIVKYENSYYQLDMVPINNGDLILGWIGFGFAIDDALARTFSETLGLSVVFYLEDGQPGVLSRAGNHIAHLGKAELSEILQGNNKTDDMVFSKFAVANYDGKTLGVALLGLEEDFLSALQDSWYFVTATVFLALIISLVGAYWISVNVSRPIVSLARQVNLIARGDYQGNINVPGTNEISKLALGFGRMQSAIVEREKTITYRANHDALTQLPNRERLIETMDKLLAVKAGFRLVHLNLQGLSDINFSLGFAVGDKLLVEIGQRLSQVMCTDDCFHTSAGQFYLIAEEHRDFDHLRNLIDECFDRPFVVDRLSLTLRFRASYIEQLDAVPGDSSLLLKNVSTALQYAERMSAHWQRYEHWMTEDIVEKFHIINALQPAIEEGQFLLYYQPKLDLRDNTIRSVEALIRWQHPARGLVPPDRFILLAEKTGYINQITMWVIKQALVQHTQWLERGMTIQVAVNISAINFHCESFYEDVVDAIEKSGSPASALKFEVTESVVAEDLDVALATMEKLRNFGIALSIDDYGTGYSSLSQLKRMPVDELKIDKSFIAGLVEDSQDNLIVKSTVTLAQSFGLEVVAEGVEDQLTLDVLRQMGLEFAQGYLISRPKSGEELTAWLERNRQYPAMRDGLKSA